MQRRFPSADFFQPNPGEPIRSVVTESAEATVVAWYVQPQQVIAAHIHPHGQDTWTILSGTGDYFVDVMGTTQFRQGISLWLQLAWYMAS